MKKLFALLAFALGVVACQKDHAGMDVNMGGEQEVMINVSLPEETRANSAVGGITNVINTQRDQYSIRYIFQVWNEDFSVSKEKVIKCSDETSVAFPVRLVPGRTYNFVVWADIVLEGSEADLHYNTTNLKAITLNGEWNAMDETRDAYTVVKEVKNFNSGDGYRLTLTRPFAKLRVITTDMLELLGLEPKGAEVEYTTEYYNQFDATTGNISTEGVKKTHTFSYDKVTAYEVNSNTDKVLFVDYFFANDEVVKFNMDVMMSDNNTVSRSFTTDIPVKRNYLTTIKGDILTDGNNIVVNVEEGFENNGDENFDITYPIEDANTLAAILTSNNKHINATLGRDIDLPISSLGQITGGSGEYKLGGEDTKAINIDLNGKTLNITTTYWSDLGAKNENALFTIKNGTMTSSQPTGTWNSYDLTFANCNYVFEDVVFDKAIALSNVGEAVTRAEATIARKSVTMKNVTINETHDYYAMWITAEGQTVNIEGLTINSQGRGIKIDEQYVDAPAKVTLNVKNAKFTTAKKAAIMVKSVAGADITLSNIDITGVAADTVNAVWIDEDANAYFDKVNVIGGSMAIEGKNTIEGENAQAAFADAVKEENAVVQLATGEYTFPNNFAKGVTVICAEGTVFTGTSNLNINGATVIGATFQSGSNGLVANYSTINGTYKNCVFNGDLKYSKAGDTIVFENCVFNGPDYALHFDTAVANSHVILKGCEVNSEWRVAIGAAVSMFEAIDTKFNVAGFINLWGKAKFTNCAFNKPYYWICSMDYTEYTNCTCEGRALVADDIRIEDTVIKINDEFYASNSESLKIALEKNASVVNLLAGNYELSGLNFVANNVTLKGADKDNVVLNLEQSIYLQNKSVTLENLTYNLNAGKGYTEQAFAFVHHATAFNLKNCNVNRLRLNVYEANIEDCTFTLNTSSGFDGYCIYYYGNDNSTVNVKNSTFATAGKGICIYSEHAKSYNLNVDKCSFTSSDSATDKAAIQMHTELGISGNVKITETTATGFADINGGLWNELNNTTGVATDKFDIWVDGTQVH